MSALRDLVSRIRQARSLGLLPPEWELLADAALREYEATENLWETESAFCLRTGSGERWCQRNFARCVAVGLARHASDGGRQWHQHARPPRGRAAVSLVQQISDTLDHKRRAS